MVGLILIGSPKYLLFLSQSEDRMKGLVFDYAVFVTSENANNNKKIEEQPRKEEP